jgi:hypothetical protein
MWTPIIANKELSNTRNKIPRRWHWTETSRYWESREIYIGLVRCICNSLYLEGFSTFVHTCISSPFFFFFCDSVYLALWGLGIHSVLLRLTWYQELRFIRHLHCRWTTRYHVSVPIATSRPHMLSPMRPHARHAAQSGANENTTLMQPWPFSEEHKHQMLSLEKIEKICLPRILNSTTDPNEWCTSFSLAI